MLFFKVKEVISRNLVGDKKNCLVLLTCGHERVVRKEFVNKELPCQECDLNDKAEKLKQVGFTLIQKVGNLYKVLKTCGHYKTDQYSNLVKSKDNCTDCYRENLKDVLQSSCLEIIEDLPKGLSKFVFINCGHQVVLSRSKLCAKTSISCDICINKEKAMLRQTTKELVSFVFQLSTIIKQEQERDKRVSERIQQYSQLGGQYIGEPLYPIATRSKYGIFKLSCDHVQDIRIDHFEKGHYRCKLCILENRQRIAIQRGVELIDNSPVDDKDFGLYKLKSCGHDCLISHWNVYNNNFACRVCGDGFPLYGKECSLYLYRITQSCGESWLKLGISTNKENRVKSYGISRDCAVDLLKEVTFDSYYEAKKVEQAIHTLRQEFKISKKKMELLMKNGYTECYPVQFESLLHSDIENFCNKGVLIGN